MKSPMRTACAALMILTGFGLLSCRSENKLTVIKLGHGLDITHPVHQAMVFLAERVAEDSQGKLRIDIYPGEQLGSERECLELLQIGSLGMTKVSCSVLEGFMPAMSVLSLPYLFRDETHRFKVLEGEIGRSLLLQGEEVWLHGLCYYDAGSRSFYTKDRPVLAPEDLKGLKIRTQESPTSMRMVQAMGGSPTPIAWGELYSALQQGVVDGAENNPPSFYTSRHYEVCRHYALDEHTGVPDVLLISSRQWHRLSSKLQSLLQETAWESARLQKKLWREATRKALEEVKRQGVTIYYPDKSPFSESVKSLYREMRQNDEFERLINRIEAVK